MGAAHVEHYSDPSRPSTCGLTGLASSADNMPFTNFGNLHVGLETAVRPSDTCPLQLS